MGQGQSIGKIEGKIPEIDLTDAILNLATAGTLGYKDGKVDKGALTRGADEFLGELTGRNMARQTNYEAGQALKAEKAAKDQQIKDEQARKQVQDISSSQSAASIKEAARAKAQSTYGVSGYQGLTTDFLGL